MLCGGVAVGLCAGAELAYDEVEQILPRNTCALIKSFMGFKLGKVCPYVESADLVIGETTCDGKKKAYELLGEMAPVYVMELPQMKRAAGPRALARRARPPRRRSSRRSPARSSPPRRSQARSRRSTTSAARCSASHAARAAVPAPITGKDALLAIQVAFYDDVPRFTQMVNSSPTSSRQRVARGRGRGARRTRRACSSPAARWRIPNWKLHDVIEKAGGVVVGEEMCTGSRYYEKLVPEDATTLDAMLDAIAAKYLDINCACFTPNPGRIDDVLRMAQEYKADGIIALRAAVLRAVPDRGDQVERAAQAGRHPVLRIDTDYSMEDVGQLAHARRGVPGDAARPDARRSGLDIGSRTVDAVWLEDGAVVGQRRRSTPASTPQDVCRASSPAASRSTAIVATGYGRHAAAERFGADVDHRDQGAYAPGRLRACSPRRARCSTSAGRTPRSIAARPGRQGRRLRDERQVRRRHRAVPRGDGPGARLRASSELGADGARRRRGGDGELACARCSPRARSSGCSTAARPRASIARGLHEAVARRTLSSLRARPRRAAAGLRRRRRPQRGAGRAHRRRRGRRGARRAGAADGRRARGGAARRRLSGRAPRRRRAGVWSAPALRLCSSRRVRRRSLYFAAAPRDSMPAGSFSILTAHTLNSAVMVTGSPSALVSSLTGDSA